MGDDDVLPAAVREELLTLDAYLVSRQRERLVHLLTRWSNYGDKIFSREPIDFDDFQAVLGARDALAAVLGRATLRTKRILEALVSHQDSLFLSGTVARGGTPETDIFGDPMVGWWWYRVPVSQGHGWTP